MDDKACCYNTVVTATASYGAATALPITGATAAVSILEVQNALCDLNAAFESLSEELIFLGMECLEGSSIVSLVLQSENIPHELTSGYIITDQGTIISPHFWVVIRIFGEPYIVDVTLPYWLPETPGMDGVTVFSKESAPHYGLSYNGEPSSDDIIDFDSDIIALSETVFVSPRAARSMIKPPF